MSVKDTREYKSLTNGIEMLCKRIARRNERTDVSARIEEREELQDILIIFKINSREITIGVSYERLRTIESSTLISLIYDSINMQLTHKSQKIDTEKAISG